ncbi:hypothetical protein EVAR_90315_1 [Eumeta japonica]|uniref:Uncharacterized protein n=1 Tax=Eumeta variegata TaxID=151549 RepID=A0A4C1ZR81_EUMVA|nr:hypothetical protein EVAR_90315_1 [Eumeta japonica]
MVSRLCGAVCAPVQSPGRRGRFGFRLPESRWNAADNGSLVYPSSRGVREIDVEVHETFVETAESLNVWAVNFNAVVGGADGLLSLSADGCSLRIFEEVSAFAQEKWVEPLGLEVRWAGTHPGSFGGLIFGDWIPKGNRSSESVGPRQGRALHHLHGMWAPMMGLCPSPAGRVPPLLFGASF